MFQFYHIWFGYTTLNLNFYCDRMVKAPGNPNKIRIRAAARIRVIYRKYVEKAHGFTRGMNRFEKI